MKISVLNSEAPFSMRLLETQVEFMFLKQKIGTPLWGNRVAQRKSGQTLVGPFFRSVKPTSQQTPSILNKAQLTNEQPRITSHLKTASNIKEEIQNKQIGKKGTQKNRAKQNIPFPVIQHLNFLNLFEYLLLDLSSLKYPLY